MDSGGSGVSSSKRRTLQMLFLLTIAACMPDARQAAGTATPKPLPSASISPSSAISLPTASLPEPTALARWRVTGLEVESLAGFDVAMQEFMQARDIPAGALAVTLNGNLVLARGYAWDEDRSYYVHPESLFRIASLSKPLTAVAVLQLVERGQLSLHDSLVELLALEPTLEAAADRRLLDITVAHLLYHVAGWDIDILGYDPMFYDREIAAHLGVSLPISQADILTFMSGQRLNHDPGLAYAYSNFGYLLLGRIIESVSGKPYEAYVQENVLHPMGIRGMQIGASLAEARAAGEVMYQSMYQGVSVFDEPAAAIPYPDGAFNLENMDSHGGWIASAIDMARFAVAFDEARSCPVLSPASIELMFSPRPGLSVPQGNRYYAMGWEVRDYGESRTTWHTGSLIGTTALMVRRRDGVNWVALFNQRDDTADPTGSTYWDIDWMLHHAADAVAAWPDHDLFDDYP
jgi:CubicO group peptidase (beta-lactamase class C family)